MPELVEFVNAQLAKAATWSRVATPEDGEPESRWKFQDREKRPWSGLARVDPVPNHARIRVDERIPSGRSFLFTALEYRPSVGDVGIARRNRIEARIYTRQFRCCAKRFAFRRIGCQVLVYREPEMVQVRRTPFGFRPERSEPGRCAQPSRMRV